MVKISQNRVRPPLAESSVLKVPKEPASVEIFSVYQFKCSTNITSGKYRAFPTDYPDSWLCEETIFTSCLISKKQSNSDSGQIIKQLLKY